MALFNQCDATRLAMREIREVNPGREAGQTEDLGYTFSTPQLAYQARARERAALAHLDLLPAGSTPAIVLSTGWQQGGIGRAELDDCATGEATPDVIGVNHYLTSERFLDHRFTRYPERRAGGNGRERYADVEAVRVPTAAAARPGTPAAQTWERYGLPIAVTEVHNGCTREEQMRWLHEMWRRPKRSARAGPTSGR